MSKHEARIVGSEDVLGETHRGVQFYGHTLTREWSPVNFSDAVLEKVKGHPHVEVREALASDAGGGERPLTKAEVAARLTELGVEFDPKAKVDDLRAALAVAEEAAGEGDGEGDD